MLHNKLHFINYSVVYVQFIFDKLLEKKVVLWHLIYFLYNNLVNNQFLNLKLNIYICQNVIQSILDSKLIFIT